MIEEFFLMLKRMGKKGQFGRRFLRKHAHKDEEALRKEILRRLIWTEEEKRGEKLDKLIDKLESRRTYGDLEGRKHIEKTINVVNNVREQIQGPEREKERLRREIERLEEEVERLEKTGKGKKEKGEKEPIINKINVDLTKHVGSFGGAFFNVLLAYSVFAIDKIIGFDGIDIGIFFSRFGEGFLPLFGRVLTNFLVLVAVAWYLIVNKFEKRDFWSYLALTFLTSLIISFGAWNTGLYHFIMVFYLYFFFIQTKDLGWDKVKTRWVMIGLLAVDYFGFGFARHFGLEVIGNRYIIPIWSYVVLVLRQKANPHWFNAVALLGLIVWSLAPIATDIFITDAIAKTTREDILKFEEHKKTVVEKFVDNVKAIYAGAKEKYIEQYEYATGMRYEGQVEENENIPLGVYFEEVETSASEFFEDESIDVWGNLLVRTLDRDTPVTVNLGCVYEEENIPGNVGGEESFTIYTMEEEVIECRFDAGTIPTGTRKIRLNADFNFKTMAYLKSYVMDKESLRSMRREGIDVFDYYGIRDKSPIAIFTNGPVKIGMETNEPPIGIDEDSTPYLGITIENQWSGNIKNISEMIVQIPRGMEFFDNCDQKFDIVTEGIEPDYNGYKLNDRGVRYFKMPIESKTGINYRSMRCLMQIKDKNRVLGDVPLTTKYFRTTISYDYELFKEVKVNIKEVPRIDEYYVIGGTCDDGNNYKRISLRIDDSDLNRCKRYLGNFSKYHSSMTNNDKIDLLMVLSLAQQESGCRDLNDGGIMQVDEDGKKKNYRGIKPEDVPECEEGEDCKVVAQIIDGINVLDDMYGSVKKENSDKKYGINELDLIKFTLLGYNRGGHVAKEAMRLYHDGAMPIYTAMKYGCEAFEEYLGKTNRDGYSLCTGEKAGQEAVGLGAAYPGAVFEIYGKACEAMGGTYDEENIG